MAKVELKKAGVAAAQSFARDLLPFIDKGFAAVQEQLRMMQEQIRAVEGQVVMLREDVQERYERQLNLINEINARMIRLEGKMEGYMEAMRVFQPLKPTRRRAG